jgi:hypothetical protein
MALHLEGINEKINEEVAGQAPTAKPEAPAPQQDELARLRAENEALRREAITEKAAAENTASDLRIKAALAAATKPTGELHLGQTDALRRKLIGQMTNFRWCRMSPAERCALLGVAGSESIKDSGLRKVYGKSSDSLLATQLRRNDPARYGAWHTVAVERGIL